MPGGLASGQLVDQRYALDEPLGEDALGTTWRAFDQGLDRPVHLRDVRLPGDLFTRDPNVLREALMAARLAIRVDHELAVHVHDAFVDGDRLVLVYRPVEYRDLAAVVERKGALAVKKAAALGVDLIGPLAVTHAKGLFHGCLSPAAVLVPEKGPAHLTGLGLAAVIGGAVAAGGGTPDGPTWAELAPDPSYLAPEQVEGGPVGPATDLWGLGAVLQFAVEGAAPFAPGGDGAARARRPPARAGALGDLLDRLLSPAAADRPSLDTALDVLAAIAGVPLGDPGPEPRRRGWRERRRRPPVAEPWTESDEAGVAGDAEDFHYIGEGIGDGEGVGEGVGEGIGEGDGGQRDWGAAVAADTAGWQWAPDEADSGGDGQGTFQDEWGEAPAQEVDRSDNWDSWGLDHDDIWLPDEYEEAAPPDVDDPFSPAGAGDDATGAREVDDVGEGDQEDRRGEPDDLGTGHRYRSAPSWPPPPAARRNMGVVVLCSTVVVVLVALLVTNGRITSSRDRDTAGGTAGNRPVLAVDPASVPADWSPYRYQAVDFGFSYPPGWGITEVGRQVIVRDGTAGVSMTVNYRDERGSDPEEVWTAQERDASGRLTSYERLQLSPASYLGYRAALWEYTYEDAGAGVHAVDLGFQTRGHSFTMSFRAPSETWDSLLPTFYAVLSSVQAPD